MPGITCRLEDLLGSPRTEMSFGLEWTAHPWSRVRVYFSDDGKEFTRVKFREIGSYDIDFKPWSLWSGEDSTSLRGILV